MRLGVWVGRAEGWAASPASVLQSIGLITVSAHTRACTCMHAAWRRILSYQCIIHRAANSGGSAYGIGVAVNVETAANN
jgi:hypothetical protein